MLVKFETKFSCVPTKIARIFGCEGGTATLVASFCTQLDEEYFKLELKTLFESL